MLNGGKILILGLILLVSVRLGASDAETSYSPVLQNNYPRNVYWGDLHIHSSLSPDSFAFGNPGLTPDNAYRFAKGEAVTANNKMTAKLSRPLDFLLVSDHAEFLGVFPKLLAKNPTFLNTELGARWDKLLSENGNLAPIVKEWADIIQNPDYEQELDPEFRRTIWQEAAAAAERHDNPGVFTAFVGYEWTSMVEGNNLHRVIVFKDGAEQATRMPPFSSLDSMDPEKLWDALEAFETLTGGEVMAIPHNGNISNGMMFMPTTLDGVPFDKAYVERRIRFEPLYEITQVKGDGEAHPFLSPDDEFADFETWDEDNIARTAKKENDMLQYEYARSALKLGLEFEKNLGTNPYEFGLVGSTDSHTTLSTSDDNNFWGKFLDSEPGEARTTNQMGGSLWLNWKLAASGYVGIWANENTRASLFDAMRRKEVYATTGPRIALRFFGGWQFGPDDHEAADLAGVGYTKGTSMGGRISSPPADTSPTFLIQALKDPDGANLDRIQVIKGWLDTADNLQERIYDVALSDGRPVPKAGEKIANLPSTVDADNATYSNKYGASRLATVWHDPDFNREERAFYYVRVLEIETPRWTSYDAAYFHRETPANVPMVTRERVYSSPIWYSPQL